VGHHRAGPAAAGQPDGARTAGGARPTADPGRGVLPGRRGVRWRALPKDFPPWQTVYGFFTRWRDDGTWQGAHDTLRDQVRLLEGGNPLPTAAVIDSQSVKDAETVGAARRGFDGGKKFNGVKRHVAVDTLGLLLVVMVTAASVQDRDGACGLLSGLQERFSTIRMVWADGGYGGRLVVGAAKVIRLTVTIVKRTDDMKGFAVLPRRWVVERTLSPDPPGEFCVIASASS